MQATDFGHFNDLAGDRRLHRSGLRAIHLQRQVCAPAQVVVEIAAQYPSEVCFPQHDDVIETLAPDTADRPLNAQFREPQGFCHGLCGATITSSMPMLRVRRARMTRERRQRKVSFIC